MRLTRTRRRALVAALALAVAPAAALTGNHGASISSITDPNALQQAAAAALTNLLGYYKPNAQGVYNQVSTPWHESGIIWNCFMDYAKWTGDTQFASLVTGALVNSSYGTLQDFLGGPLASVEQTINGKWNDDILWPAHAFVAGAEMYGSDATVPAANGPWYRAPQTTLVQTWDQESDTCGGGIYWSRDRSNAANGDYKSFITEAEFMQVAARVSHLQSNSTLMDQAGSLLAWVRSASLLNSDGTINDGMHTSSCNTVISDQWSYNYGEMMGALAFMNLVSGDSALLDTASTILAKSLSLFFTTDSITEQCETTTKGCSRDAQGFKAVYVRNLAYLYRQTGDSAVKSAIQRAIDSSVTAMVTRSCDANWNCNGNWTSGSAPVSYVRSQHVSSALLVAALGVHATSTGTGLITSLDNKSLSTTGSGSTTGGGGQGNVGSVTWQPLGAASGLLSTAHFAAFAGLGTGLLALLAVSAS